jgi:heat shock protein HslJ
MKYVLCLLLAPIFIACFPKIDTAAAGKVYTYWVDSAKAPCSRVAPYQCLRVKKGADFASTDWGNFFSPIEGFDYEPGHIYQLFVKETKRAPSRADASSVIYTLVKVVEKKVDTKLRLHDIWALEAIGIEERDFTDKTMGIEHPNIEFNLTRMQVMGTDGCNGFLGDITSLDETSLSLGPLLSTLMACPDLKTPDQVTKALKMVAAYRIKDLKLELLDKSGQVLLRYRKVD